MKDRFDIIAIGGGTAGLVTAAGASYLGARAALIERDRLGGECLWTGCVPSKALLASAGAAQIRRDAGALGLYGKAMPPDFAAVMASMRQAREVVSHHDDPARFRALGVDVVTGAAEFVDGTTVRVGDRRLSARRIVIATGSSPDIPPVPGLPESGFVTHQTVFDLDEAPSSVAVIGAGPIGVEFSQIFQRHNIPVTLFEIGPEILGNEDPAAAAVVRHAIESEGVKVESGVSIVRVEREQDDRVIVWRRGQAAEVRSRVGAILVAAGRKPSLDGLSLDRIGVETNQAGVMVDARLRSSRPGIWAAGDVSGGLQFTHIAEYQAKLVLRNALTPFPSRADYRVVPRVTYCDPELAQVGASEPQLISAGVAHQAYRYDLADLDRAIAERRRDGFVKLLATPNGGLLGATIVGRGAGELLAPVILAMQHRLPISALAEFIYPYPTMSEGLKRAADVSQRRRLDSLGGRLLKRIIQWRL